MYYENIYHSGQWKVYKEIFRKAEKSKRVLQVFKAGTTVSPI